MGKRTKVGDVIEIPTPTGKAYAQFTHKHPMFGALIRVFPGVRELPGQLSELVQSPPQFLTFFPLQAAIDRGIVTVVGNSPVPVDAQPFPTFRAGMRDPASGRISAWWLWDGDKEWRVGEITAEQRRLPIREVVNDTLLIERILSGWRPEVDPA